MRREISNFNFIILFVFSLFLLLPAGCTSDDEESVRDRTIRLLTDNSSKYWMVDKSYLNNNEEVLSSCDSTYLLIMNSDFTWTETNLTLSCSVNSEGIWTLNDENNVISIQYEEHVFGILMERHFEIMELSDNHFTYQFAENNNLKKIRLTKYMED